MNAITRQALELWVQSIRETETGNPFLAAEMGLTVGRATVAILGSDDEHDFEARALLEQWTAADHIGPIKDAIRAYHDAVHATEAFLRRRA